MSKNSIMVSQNHSKGKGSKKKEEPISRFLLYD